MLNRLGDRAILILALSPAAIFILIVFIVVVGPRLTASSTPEAVTPQATVVTPQATIVTATTIPATATATPSPQPTMPTPTPTPADIIIRQGDFNRLS